MAQELATLARQTADRLAEEHVGVVVAAVADGAVEIRGAGAPAPARAVPPDRTPCSRSVR
ncbi:hypothetical protein [Streptomyces sp. NRRL F-4474]|uniref:hypothetical protein n=1 Tax=Streptomyces sp. NRRL F-4474 TaxID=1463851 RepID=UPI00068CC33F|nr:hypothetical protein [Streptomyces sp. NRRL F-4474]